MEKSHRTTLTRQVLLARTDSRKPRKLCPWVFSPRWARHRMVVTLVQRRAMNFAKPGFLIQGTALLLISAHLYASTYYVSPSGQDAGPGTQSQPFATLQAAVTHLEPGDSLIVREGTYYGPVTIP